MTIVLLNPYSSNEGFLFGRRKTALHCSTYLTSVLIKVYMKLLCRKSVK